MKISAASLTRTLQIGGLSVAMLGPLAVVVEVHSFLVDANPSAKDHVTAEPKTFKLKFGGGVEAPYSKLTIEIADGEVLAEGAVAVREKPRELTIDGPDLTPVKYMDRYHVLSTDGHIVEGNYDFTVDTK